MPAGLPYFAWIAADETTFGSEHMRWDEQVLSFELSQEEGNPANLTIVVRGPQKGLLAPGRSVWAWFALDCGPGLIKFRGRLVGIPTSLFDERVTLEFIAKPVDLVEQKKTVADSLRVLPFYDPVVIDPQKRDDPDVVLEGYTKIWHFDRETHVVSVSDEILGEDGLIEFNGLSEDATVFYDGLQLNLTSGPLARVDVVEAEYTWTQTGSGGVDLTSYLLGRWPGAVNGVIQANASDWPKPGTSIGDGWQVTDSSATDLHNFQLGTDTIHEEFVVKFSEGDVSRATVDVSQTGLRGAITAGSTNQTKRKETFYSTFRGPPRISHTVSSSWTSVAVQEIKPTLHAGYTAGRQCTEKVSLTLIADVQPILTDPEDGEALRIDDIKSVNLSEPLEESGEIPIGDTRRSSYIATERGNRSIEHLIVLARAHLMKRARVVEITFAPKLAHMSDITLRKNAFLAEPRVGEALGKIIAYSVALDGSDGRINCMVKIGCTVGRGGTVSATDGSPTYATDYTGADYQQFIDRFVLLDTSVGYQPPNADPDDDGVNLLSNSLTWRDIIDQHLDAITGPAPEFSMDQAPTNVGGGDTSPANVNALMQAQNQWVQNAILPQYETQATFKLKSMTADFETAYDVPVTDLKIPTGYNLEAG